MTFEGAGGEAGGAGGAQRCKRCSDAGDGGNEGHLLLRLRAVRVAEADGIDACVVAPFVLGWVLLRMDLLSALCVLCVLRTRTPPYALMMHAFVGRVEGKRALHLPLGGIDVVA